MSPCNLAPDLQHSELFAAVVLVSRSCAHCFFLGILLHSVGLFYMLYSVHNDFTIANLVFVIKIEITSTATDLLCVWRRGCLTLAGAGLEPTVILLPLPWNVGGMGVNRCSHLLLLNHTSLDTALNLFLSTSGSP